MKPKMLSAKDIKNILSSFKNPNDKFEIKLQTLTGISASELTNLSEEDIEKNAINIIKKEHVHR